MGFLARPLRLEANFRGSRSAVRLGSARSDQEGNSSGCVPVPAFLGQRKHKTTLFFVNENCGIMMNLRVPRPRITHTGLSYDKALLPEARVTGLILNDIRKTRDAGY